MNNNDLRRRKGGLLPLSYAEIIELQRRRHRVSQTDSNVARLDEKVSHVDAAVGHLLYPYMRPTAERVRPVVETASVSDKE